MNDKLDMQSPNWVHKNAQSLAELFPNCVTETAEGIKVDFDLLKQELSADLIEGNKERYRLEWPGKREAIVTANLPTTKTLRPIREDSVNFDTTENLYIEGDNLEVLKLLQENYLGKIKMIYIDPPYNTGKDFVYKDNFKQDGEEYKEESGEKDEYNQRLFVNPETAGRYHSNWLSMIYPRLKLARNLLADDGVIFISIDDNEVDNLKKICNEIFGEGNFFSTIVWQKKYAATNDAKKFSTTHDYIVAFQKSDAFKRILLPRTEKQNKPYKNDDGDGKGLWRSDNLLVKSFSKSGVFPIKNPKTKEDYYPPEGSSWRGSKDTIDRWLSEQRIFFGKDGKGAPQLKRYLNEVQQGRVPITWWTFEDVGHNDAANKEMGKLFGKKTPFDTPKPSSLIQQMLRVSVKHDDIVLDFFSGSSSCAHAVMNYNIEKQYSLKNIQVQLDEATDENSEAYKQGYKNICEIGKERIRRAGKAIIEEQQSKIKTLESKISSVVEKIAKLQEGKLNIEDPKITALQEEQQGYQTEIIKLQEGIDNLDIGFECIASTLAI